MDEEVTTDSVETRQSVEQLRHRLGARLQTARLKKEISVDDAADKLHIRSHYLKELESGQWQEMPEEVYALSFLRQYANLLGEDISQELHQLKTGDYHLTKPFTMPDPPIAPNRNWAIAAVAAFVLLFILFNVFEEDYRAPEQPVETVPQPEQVKPDTPAQVEDQEKQLPDATAPDDQPDKTPPQEEKAETADAPDKKEGQTPSGQVHRYKFTAVDEAVWLQVFNDKQTLLHEVLLRPGESLNLENDGAALFITCGNAVALSIDLDGKEIVAAGSLGERGKVLRDYRVAPPFSQ